MSKLIFTATIAGIALSCIDAAPLTQFQQQVLQDAKQKHSFDEDVAGVDENIFKNMKPIRKHKPQAPSQQSNTTQSKLSKEQSLQSFDEEQWIGSVINGKRAASVAGNVGISSKWEEETTTEQQIELTKALKKATQIIIKANESGLLEEDEWSGYVEGSYGSSGWGVGIGIQHTWDEENENDVEQKLNVRKILDKAVDVITTANQSGLLQKSLESKKQASNLRQAMIKTVKVLKTTVPTTYDEEQWGGEIYGEYGRQNGQNNWKVGGKITFDEDEQQQQYDELQGGEIYGECSTRGKCEVGVKVTWDEDEKPTVHKNKQQPKPEIIKPHGRHPDTPEMIRYGYPNQPPVLNHEIKPKWSHQGFKPKFQKPSSLQFTKKEQF